MKNKTTETVVVTAIEFARIISDKIKDSKIRKYENLIKEANEKHDRVVSLMASFVPFFIFVNSFRRDRKNSHEESNVAN